MRFIFSFLYFILSISCCIADELPKETYPPSLFDDLKDDAYGPNTFMGEMVQMLIVLGGILGLMLAGSWFIKRTMNSRMQQMNTTSDIKILERRMLSGKTIIYLIDVRGKGVLLGESPTGLTHLGEININNPPPHDGPSFEDILRNNPKN